MKRPYTSLFLLLFAIVPTCFVAIAHATEKDDIGEHIYELRPEPNAPKELGHIGPTGIRARVEKGVKVTIEGTREGSPAAGKFKAGEVILSVNGNSLKGVNPYVVLGSAITTAEAKDGKMVFELESKAGQRMVTVQIPVLGAYGEKWPRDCSKSSKIIQEAAAYYSKSVESKGKGIPSALSCLFLLSTGDDAHLPVVKEYVYRFINEPNSIGNHTWNNGYNGIACAEYYFRTGDKEVLPVLQAICDDARDRQNFDSAWKHWGSDINPGYVGGGLMNPASTQVLTTLLLSKEAGVNVDEKTLMNALRYFWRFIGHGSVPYGDHRSQGGVASNGKDGMMAAAMQIATDSSGNTSIYESARDYLSMATLISYPGMVMGHADNGRGDGIWRGIGSSYLIEKEPKLYQSIMNKISWWYDLSRFDDGAMGLATCKNFNESGSGAGAVMTYTAPLKTLRITGAPRSKYAKEFELPERLWGTEADLAFLSIKPIAGYEKYGKAMPIHQIFNLIGSAYYKGSIETDPDSVSLEQLNRLVRHNSYKIRTQAAKALRIKGELKVLEGMLRDPDPRLRRTALDGIINWNYFFNSGEKGSLAAERFTPEMIKLITAMLTDPKESIYVVEGALFAVGYMPVDVVQKNIESILPWTKNDDWWLRHAAFVSIQSLERDPETYVKVIPLLTELMVSENHTMPRGQMNRKLTDTLKKVGPSSNVGILLLKGLEKGVMETKILAGPRGREAKFNINDTILKTLNAAPESAAHFAQLLVESGLQNLDDDELLGFISGDRFFKGFLHLASKLKGPAKENLDKVLYDSFRPEMSKRLKASKGLPMEKIDAVLGLIQLRDENKGWEPVGSPIQEERDWQYTSFDPIVEKDILPKYEGRRYREVTLPSGFENWFKPDFDASKWKRGKAPIGKGGHPKGPRIPTQYPSDWGEGELLLARTSFDLKSNDYDMYRLRVLCNNGFVVYLNGQQIRTFTWWSTPSEYRIWPMSSKDASLLKKGTNTIAVYGIATFPAAGKAHWEKWPVFGECDVYIEGLKKEDLY